MKNKKNVKDAQELAQEALFSEVSDEVRQDQMLEFWNKYKYVFIASVVAFILGVAGWEFYTSHRNEIRLTESDIYEQATILNAQGQSEAALQKYETLEVGKTNYKYLAQMRRAGILFEQENNAEGIALLNNLRQNKDAPQSLRVIADLAFVSHQIEDGKADELQAVLKPYLMADNAWYGSAAELSALLLVRENKFDEAQKVLTDALAVPSLPLSVKERLTIMQKALEQK